MADRYNTDPTTPTTGQPSYGGTYRPGEPGARTGGSMGSTSGKPEGDSKLDTVKEQGQQALDTVKEQGQHAMDQAKERGQQAAGAAGEKLDQGIDRAADAAQGLAHTLRDQAHRLPGDKPTEIAHQAASTIERGAEYLRQNDAAMMRDDLEGLIRRHPTQSLMVGLAIGFLVARAFR